MIDTSKYTQNPLVIASNQFAASFEKDPSGDKRAWLKGVRDATRTFYEVLDEHRRDSEEDIGMLHQVLARKPGLMPAATRLAHEHADMLHRASELEIECDRQLASDEPNVEIVRLEASVLRTIVLLHLLRTNDLIYEAYFRTEGGSS